MSRLVRVAPVALLCTSAFAQDTSPSDSAATFRSRVQLVTVPVVVRDKTGKSVGDLNKEDFELLDKGKLQVISRFSIEKSTDQPVVTAATPVERPPDAKQAEASPGGAPKSPQATVPARFVAYMFDDLHIEQFDLNAARDAAEKQIREGLRSTNRAAIFTTSGQGMLDFTRDREKIHDALVALRPRSRQLNSTECPPSMTYLMADLIQNKHDQATLALAVEEAKGCDPFTPEVSAQGAAARIAALGEAENITTLHHLKNVIERVAATPGQRVLILVSPGFYIADEYVQEETDLIERAIHAKIIINGVAARGLHLSNDLSLAIAGRTQLAASQFSTKDAFISEGTLASLAYGSGGQFFHNNNDLLEGLRQVAIPPEYIYMLGFSPQNLKLDGKFHALKVSIRNPDEHSRGFDLQFRSGYYAPKGSDDSAAQAKRELSEALFSLGELRDIPVDLETHFSKPTATDAKLTLTARIDVRTLHYQKTGGRNIDTLTIVARVFDHDGALINTFQKSIDMRLKDQTLAAQIPSGIQVDAGFDLKPGKYVVRFIVRDGDGQSMAARNGSVEIP